MIHISNNFITQLQKIIIFYILYIFRIYNPILSNDEKIPLKRIGLYDLGEKCFCKKKCILIMAEDRCKFQFL